MKPHVSLVQANAMRAYGTLLWMDPGVPAVRDRTVQVVLDVVRRYDIDGVHFDDYFYPYPNGQEFPDAETYEGYVKAGGTLAVEDWRRQNVHDLVAGVRKGIDVEKPWVRFGISPFGIYRPGMPEGIKGLDQYAEIYADPVKWMDEGWVDYLAPQLYWPTTQSKQAYEPLLQWWTQHADPGRPVLAGHFLSQLDTSPEWSVAEFEKQLAICRASPGCEGDIWYNVGPLLENRKGIADKFRDELYATPALTPVMPGRTEPVPPPKVEVTAEGVRLGGPEDRRSFVVYVPDGDGWRLERIVPGSVEQVQLPAGRYAISVAARDGAESQGVVVTVGG